MTIKEELFALMERIAKPWPTKTITVIICCESETNSLCSMVGYRNDNGIGTVLHIAVSSDIISKLMADAWEAANNRNNAERDDEQ